MAVERSMGNYNFVVCIQNYKMYTRGVLENKEIYYVVYILLSCGFRPSEKICFFRLNAEVPDGTVFNITLIFNLLNLLINHIFL